MRPLKKLLQDHDLIVLRVIGEWWELDLTGSDEPNCMKALNQHLLQLNLSEEIGYLPPEEGAAFMDLVAQNGRMPVATYGRSHGEVRLMGPAKMEREEPWLDPVSPAEALWYRGLIYRSFEETPEGLIEFYCLPDEFLAQIAPSATAPATPEKTVIREAPVTAVPGFDIRSLKTAASLLPKSATPPAAQPTPPKPAIPKTPAPAIPAPQAYQEAPTSLVDDLTTLLAFAQVQLLSTEHLAVLAPYLLDGNPIRLELLCFLAQEMGLLRRTENGLRPSKTAVGWLKDSREKQLRSLAEAWQKSAWNDLHVTPGLLCEGEGWQNDPLLARNAVLAALPRTADWFNVADFVATIHKTTPDFQRPDGNYDTWYIRDIASDTFITGFGQWDWVEGRLLRFLLQSVLVWLGMVETAVVASHGVASQMSHGALCRLTPRALDWLEQRPATGQEEPTPLVVQADATLVVPQNTDRHQRFQVARISQPQPVQPNQPYQYVLTPASLTQAGEQGIAPDRVLQFLENASGPPLPPSIKRAITRWAENGVEGRLETAVILRVRSAEILDTLRNNPKTRALIGESLGDLAATVRLKDWQALRQAIAQLGLLLETNIHRLDIEE